MSMIRSRWAAVGAAVAVTLGAGGISLVDATEPSDATTLVQVEPCRLADTRTASQVGPKASPLGPNETYAVAVHGTNGDCTIPATATGLSMNVTAVGASENTFLTFWGDGERPNAANLNPRAGTPPTPNAVVAPLTANGTLQVFNRFGQVDIVIDVNGYYTNHDHDDRYYTTSQVDEMYGHTKFLSLDVFADPGLNFDEEREGNLADFGVGGLNLDVDFSFTVPPDYTAGSPMTVRAVAYATDTTSFPCNGELTVDWVYAARPGSPEASNGTSALSPFDILHVFTAPNVPREYLFTLDSDPALQPGDAVGFGLAGFGPSTRCRLLISGMAIYYD